VKLRLAALLAVTLLSACRHVGDITAENGGGVYAVRSDCPIAGIPAGTGDVTLFNPPGSTVASAIDGDEWVLTVRDDGRGFDVAAVAARGRRNFGLQFMRERAELIGARFEVHSRPDGGTLVRLAIPVGTEETS